ncbi:MULTISPECIES: hypothetical protein [unclassified Rhizobium]|uniref:hypothetical protein n=1 Tax=unclassified Rhizobium TaxID=2613769 RepID=UPI00177E01F0|nr:MULTISPECIES: hypothetical protein [unclassified Rhizobium]MBD8685566.1 hypothetical protein [Rhizobium sp. CFBP 13644]MBD8690761.1 hypothetical protein [Rhizobium sp. CFBP 13717]
MPYELLIITRVVSYSWFIPPFLLFWRADNTSRTRRKWTSFLWIWLVSYVYIVTSVLLIDEYVSWRLNTFDLDGSQSFTDEELMGEAGKWYDAMVRDTARTVIPITGVIFATIAIIGGYVMTLIRRGLGRLIRAER